jgi:hypothetical protein
MDKASRVQSSEKVSDESCGVGLWAAQVPRLLRSGSPRPRVWTPSKGCQISGATVEVLEILVSGNFRH